MKVGESHARRNRKYLFLLNDICWWFHRYHSGCIRSFATVYKHIKQVSGGKHNIHQKRLWDLDFEEARLSSAFADKLRKIQEAREIIQEEARVVDIVDLNMFNIDGCVEGLVAQSQTRERGSGAPVYTVPDIQERLQGSCSPIPPLLYPQSTPW